MEKESDNAGGFEHGKGRKKYLYDTGDAGKGEVKIADEVVAIIAALAATEVEGVSLHGGQYHE